MLRPSEQAKKAALALAFGVVMHGSVISGIPGHVNGLARALSCSSCKMEHKKGVPAQFSTIMTDEQKKAYKKALRRRSK